MTTVTITKSATTLDMIKAMSVLNGAAGSPAEVAMIPRLLRAVVLFLEWNPGAKFEVDLTPQSELTQTVTDDDGGSLEIMGRLDWTVCVRSGVYVKSLNIEVDGYAYHSREAQFELDRKRDRVALLDRVPTVRFAAKEALYGAANALDRELVNLLEYLAEDVLEREHTGHARAHLIQQLQAQQVPLS